MVFVSKDTCKTQEWKNIFSLPDDFFQKVFLYIYIQLIKSILY